MCAASIPANVAAAEWNALKPSVGHVIRLIKRWFLGLAEGYRLHKRSRGETLMGHWKTVIGPKLMAHDFENQRMAAKISVRVFNRMTGFARPF